MRDLKVEAIELDSFDLDAVRSGHKARLRLAVPGVTATELPAMVVCGAAPGPTIVICGGVHGDEFEARAGMRQVFEALEPERFAGRLLGLPICNPWAFCAGTRCSPPACDGLNLAREFPGDPHGSATQRLAYHVAQLILRHAGPEDLVVDLHSGGTFYTYKTMSGFRDHPGPTRPASEQAARHTGLECLWAMDPVPGTLTQFAAEHGIPSVGTEFRGQGLVRPEDVADCTIALRNLLAFAGNIDGEPPSYDPRPPRRTTTVLAPAAGFLPAMPELGATVAAEQVLCVITDCDDTTVASVEAGVDGDVWAVRSFPVVEAGDILALIAHPEEI